MRLLLSCVVIAGLAWAQEHTPPPPGGGESHGDKTGHAAETAPEGAAVHQGAAEQHKAAGHAAMPNEIWWKWANFFILAGVLGYLINKHAGSYFHGRAEEITSGLAGAAAMRAEAEARAAAIENQIANLSAEVDALRRSSREEMEAESERMRRETELALAKVRSQAQAEIESGIKAAKQELKEHSAQLALRLAETKIAQRIGPETQRQLAQEFVADLKNKAALN